jgi:UDP-N-acetyl-alpha-D-quinovosamine dehydrogenase
VSTKGLVVVLGAAGFVGRALTTRLAAAGTAVRAVTRAESEFPPGVSIQVAGTLSSRTSWAQILDGARTAVHLASRAHAPPGNETWVTEETETAAALAEAARKAGLERLIFMSSIKAMGEITSDAPFRADGIAKPTESYGRAKLAIERALADSPNLVVLRPPLIYGPGVKGNFRTLLGLVACGFPLPLASIANHRSMIFIDNLLDLIEIALDHVGAPGKIWLLRDGDDISTPGLFRKLAQHCGKQARLFPCPPDLLRQALRLAGRGRDATALIDSLSVDDGPTRALLGWRPRIGRDDGLAATCHWFEAQRR